MLCEKPSAKRLEPNLSFTKRKSNSRGKRICCWRFSKNPKTISGCGTGIFIFTSRFLPFESSEPYKNYFITVFDLCTKTLEDYVKNEVDEADITQINPNLILQSHLISALKFLYEQEICHGDIKVKASFHVRLAILYLETKNGTYRLWLCWLY